MIEHDIRTRYRPGSGKLRLCCITDGDDCLSPPPFNGVKGMDPLMRSLKQQGFDIEWHIIIVGDEVSEPARYEALTKATGGTFIQTTFFDVATPSCAAYLKQLKASCGGDASHIRAQRQSTYALEAKTGRAPTFDWFQLPSK
jgi:hypothetical protein